MKDEWQSMAIEDLFALHEQMVNVLKAKLFAKRTELERQLLMLGQQPKLLETVKPGLPGPLIVVGQCGCAWKLLPLAKPFEPFNFCSQVAKLGPGLYERRRCYLHTSASLVRCLSPTPISP